MNGEDLERWAQMDLTALITSPASEIG